MSDESIATRIEQLVAQEHELRSREQDDDAEALDADAQKLKDIEVQLDVCWDLLRRRRALRESGANPDEAAARDPDTVERYLQ